MIFKMKKVFISFLLIIGFTMFATANDTYGWGHNVVVKSINTYSNYMLIEFSGGQMDANSGIAYFDGTTPLGKSWLALLINAMNNGYVLNALVHTNGATYNDHFSKVYYPLAGIYINK
jgi:hypothetical protein